jgi:hypothetical protein
VLKLQNSKQMKTNSYIMLGEIVLTRKAAAAPGVELKKAEKKKNHIEVKNMTFKDTTISGQKKGSLA